MVTAPTDDKQKLHPTFQEQSKGKEKTKAIMSKALDMVDEKTFVLRLVRAVYTHVKALVKAVELLGTRPGCERET